MKLYVMRHGPAEEPSATGVDALRALTPAGRDRVRSVVRALLEASEQPARIVASPYVRTVETAEIVAAVLREQGADQEATASVERRAELAPGGQVLSFCQELAASGARRVMLVGHEPDLSALVSRLLGSPLRRPFEKAMVIGLRMVPNGRAHLRFVLEPKGPRLVPGDAPV